MGEFIRQESDMQMCFPSDSDWLLDQETIFAQHNRWRNFKSPEFVSYSPEQKILRIVEAKCSAPQCSGPSGEKLQNRIVALLGTKCPNALHHARVMAPYEVFIQDIIEKFQNSILSLLQCVKEEWSTAWRCAEGQQKLNFPGVDSDLVKRVELVLIVRKHKTDWIPELDAIFQREVSRYIAPWMEKVRVKVMNSQSAKVKGFIRDCTLNDC